MSERQALRLADGGMETVLIFHRGLELPCFASFPLLPAVIVLGGCCGTDRRHVAAVVDAWLAE